ncbi:hypothetical protein ACFLRB_05170, partial [Acidobacteriota bacterium]
MKKLIVVIFVFFLLNATGTGTLYCLPQDVPLKNEAGFITIKPVDFYFHDDSKKSKLELRSSEARLWYVFQPADQDSNEKPLFVFFNGGPGSATSSGLFSLNTSRMTLDTTLEKGGDEFIANPVSWTGLGNLLYIDARATGFSYNLMNSPGDEDARRKEFDAQNFNVFFDAADFIRVILDFLSNHPELRENPVVITAESYGGIRSNIMLHLLLNYKDYANGKEMYQDIELVESIQAHYNNVFPTYQNKTVPPGIIAGQFGHQILIQPLITGDYQYTVTGEMFEEEDSPIFEIAAQVGDIYIPCRQIVSNWRYCNPWNMAMYFVNNIARRDWYYYIEPKEWLNGFFYNAGMLLCFTENLSLATGVDVTAVPEFYSAARTKAYKYFHADLDFEIDGTSGFEKMILKDAATMEAAFRAKAPGDMSEVFGKLQPWDKYFLLLNYDANIAFYENIAITFGYDVSVYSPNWGTMFLKNVVFVNTFITNAAYDLVVYTRALPASLRLHDDILESVAHQSEEPVNEARPGRIKLKYQANAFPGIQNLHTRIIRFPVYATSSHAVSVNQPEE